MAFENNAISTPSTHATPRITTQELGADEFTLHREVLKEQITSWDESNLVSMLEITDRAVVSQSVNFHHFEDSLLLRSVKIDTVKAGGTADTVVVTLTADSYTTTGGKTRSPLRANNLLWLGPGVQALVTNKSSNSPTSGMALTPTGELSGTPTAALTEYTLRRVTGGTANLNTIATALASSKASIGIPTNAYAEGSYQPIEGLDNLSPRYSGTMQIFKQHQEITGTADSVRTEFTFNGSTYYFDKQMINGLLTDKAEKNFAIMYNTGGSYVNANGDEVRTTMGLEGHIKSRGINYTYTSGAFGVSDLEAIINRIKAVRGGTEYFWMLGPKLRSLVEAVVRELPTVSISYTNWGNGDAAKKAIDLGINSFRYNGVTFHFMEIALHPEVDGLAIYKYDETGFLIPSDQQSVNYQDRSGQVQRGKINSAQLRYLSQGGPDGSRRFDSWSGGRKENNGRDVRTWDCLSEMGLQVTGVRKFFRIGVA